MIEPTRRTVLASAAGAGAIRLAGLTANPTRSPNDSDTAPVLALIGRYLGMAARQFELRRTPSDGSDRFQIGGTNGHILLAGSSGSALSAGFNWWLKYVAGAHISWDGTRLDLPRVLPAPAQPITRSTSYRIRLQGNPTWTGYTSPYWDWNRWQQEIDYFAVSGYNHVTVSIGQEIVYYSLLRDYGYTDAEARAWIPLPTHQPWWWLDNLYGVNGPISMDLMRRRAELAARILGRLRSLGIAPVIPGFMGFVPTDFGTRHPGTDVVQQGPWGAYTRPALLNPVTSLFTEMAADYYRHQQRLFGKGGYAYSGDFLHEGGLLGDIDLTAAAGATQQAIRAAAPGALWMLQGWSGNPRKELIAGVDKSTVFVLDYQADVAPQWKNNDAWWGAPWTWGTISNAGGDITLYGRLPAINTGLPETRTAPGHGDLAGVHFAPEGNDTNPVLADFFADMIWRDAPVDLPSWIEAYAKRRYGIDDPHAREAWLVLLATADGVEGNSGNVDTGPDSLFNAQPSLTTASANLYGATTMPYDPSRLFAACRNLLDADPRLRTVDTYRYDLLDVARQLLDNAARTLLPQINGAYLAADRARFRSLTGHWLDLISLQDRLLGTDGHFLLGTWLADADRAATSHTERIRLGYDARDILTAWGDRAAADAGLRDYANRDWQGLVGDLYRHRWKLYFDGVEAALAGRTTPASIDWFAVDNAWSERTNRYPTTPSGETHVIAGKVWDLLSADPMFGQVSAVASPDVVAAGDTATVTVAFTNAQAARSADNVALGLTAPAGVTVKPSSPVAVGDVSAGSSGNTTFTVAVPASHRTTTAMDQITLTGSAAFQYAQTRGTNAGYASLLVPAPVQAPYRTVAFTPSAFGQQDDTFAIYAGGADMWGGTNEFAAIYKPAALAVGGSITTQVTSQAATEQWARAGIVIRDDLTKDGSAGYLDLAVTPSNGLAMSYDSNGDGQLDQLTLIANIEAPIHLRVVRDSATGYTGFYSADGAAWTKIGAMTLPGSTATQDVGLFGCAASTTRGLDRFTGFILT